MRDLVFFLCLVMAVGGCANNLQKGQVDVGKMFLAVGDDFNRYCVPANQKISPETCNDFKKFAPEFKATYPNFTSAQKAQLDAFNAAATAAKGGK